VIVPDTANPKRPFVYDTTLSGWAGLLLLVPLLLVFFSLVATLLAGGAVAAFVLPLFFRRLRAPSRPADATTIELDPTQYTRVETPRQQLPPG
jgi:hypothetical protein